MDRANWEYRTKNINYLVVSIPWQSVDAFSYISNDPDNKLVAEYKGQVEGMLQLTFIPYLGHMGSWRCLIENVRIHSQFRGQGLGTKIFHWAIERAKKRQ